MTQQEKFERFLGLHAGPEILVLPNAWDVISARIFEDAGFPAIASTSAGVAACLGYADGENIPREDMLKALSRIVEAVTVPVSADIESGYGDPTATVKAVAEIGAIGVNLEDTVAESATSLAEIGERTALIRRIVARKLPVVINARTDIFLAAIGDPATRLQRTVERLNAYRDAGAHSLFAPGVTDSETIAALVREVRGPLNVLASAGTPTVKELQRLGVARVSLGSGASRAALGLVRRIARDLRERGSFDSMVEGAMPYANVNGLLSRKA